MKKPDLLNLIEIGARLEAVRTALNKTQRDISNLFDISPSSMSEMESGNIRPQYPYLFILARDFHVNLNWVFTGMGAMFNPDFEIKWDFGQDTQRVLDLLYLIENSPEVRYIMLANFIELEKNQKHVIQRCLAKRRKLKTK